MLGAPIVAVALCVTGLWSMRADACSCAVPGLPCEAVWRSDVVFTGRVVSFESPAPGTGTRGVEFAVIQNFRGPQLRTIVVASAGGCGYSFKIGESYLVYASDLQGTLTTSICTRTRPLRDAADDLAYAQSLSAATLRPPARVPGKGPDLGAAHSREWRPEAHGRQKAAQTSASSDGDREWRRRILLRAYRRRR